MILNLIEELNIKGHLTISKILPHGEELIFDDANVIVSGMGVALAHLFALSGSNSILDYQIDRFQVGVSGTSNLQVSSTNKLAGSLTSLSEYAGNSGGIFVTSGHKIINNSIVTQTEFYSIIPQNNITRIDGNTVRYTLFMDSDSCNNLTRNSSPAQLNEIGLFIKNIKAGNPAAPILVAYKYFNPIRKSSDFALVFRWSINF